MEAGIERIQQDLLDTLESKLGDLAALWRGQQQLSDADVIALHYQAILRCMIELGFNDELDVESELPERLMPPEYLNLFENT